MEVLLGLALSVFASRTVDDIDETVVLARADDAGIPFNWMRSPRNDVNTVSVYEVQNGWRVSTTNERATEESVEDYSDRGAAVGDFIRRVESFLRADELRTKLLGR